MKWFGRKSAGRADARPVLARGWATAEAVRPWTYEEGVRAGYVANPIVQRAVRLIAEGVGAVPLVGPLPPTPLKIQEQKCPACLPPRPPDSPARSLVGSAATGAFAGKADAVAIWTAGGWRFLSPFDGVTVWRRDAAAVARKTASGWRSGDAIPPASGGSTIDTEARTAIAAIVTIIRDFGITTA